MPMPGAFERSITEINAKHATIACKLSIIHHATLRTTTTGIATVDASKLINKTRAEIESAIADYAEMVSILAGLVDA
jgi:hypothetical protein